MEMIIRKIDKRTGTWKIEHKSTYAVAQRNESYLFR